LAILGILLVFALFFVKWDIGPYFNEFPSFVSEYKQSDSYWVSAIIAGYYGATNTEIFPEYNIYIVTIIFLLPLCGYYAYYYPFGLSCEFRPVNEEKNVIDLFAEKKRLAEKSGDRWDVDLKVSAGKHISEYSLKFENPSGTEIYHVQTYTDKDEKFDPHNNTLTVQSERDDDFVVGIYLQETTGITGSDRELKIREVTTGKCLTTVTLGRD
jgi:hypothetical protein